MIKTNFIETETLTHKVIDQMTGSWIPVSCESLQSYYINDQDTNDNSNQMKYNDHWSNPIYY